MVNDLAEDMTPNKDATVWTIKLKRGVTFHDGKDLTADDVIFTLRRIADPRRRSWVPPGWPQSTSPHSRLLTGLPSR